MQQIAKTDIMQHLVRFITYHISRYRIGVNQLYRLPLHFKYQSVRIAYRAGVNAALIGDIGV